VREFSVDAHTGRSAGGEDLGGVVRNSAERSNPVADELMATFWPVALKAWIRDAAPWSVGVVCDEDS
jgi:hypothetical protein